MPAKRIAIFNHGPGRQRGAALMVMLAILILGITVVLVDSLTAASVNTARQEKTAAALAQAKDALIGYAITYGDTHTSSPQVDGYLLCPDIDGKDLSNNPAEGSAELSCGNKNVSVIGRLPWKTLGLSQLHDGDGECLWYAISGTYKNSPNTDMMNWDTNGLLSVTDAGGNTISDVVAVIFAPGPVLSGQNRSPSGAAPICGGNYTASNYLDNDGTHNNSSVSAVANAVSSFFSGSSSQVNDRLIYITRQDIWNAVQKRTDFQPRNPGNPSLPNLNNPLVQLTNQVTLCLQNYMNNNTHDNWSLPWPAQLSLSDYSINTNYNDAVNLYAGRVPYLVGTARATTGNTLGNLMTAGSCGAGWTSSIDTWWNNWKDHLFYALSSEYSPTNTTHQGCGTCLHVNGFNNYAGVVMFAGPRLIPPLSTLNQTRANKSVVTDYLESANGTNFSGANGNENYFAAPPSSNFNDIVCVISNQNSANCL